MKNIRDYGAVPDEENSGLTFPDENTRALAWAAVAGEGIYIPAGRYTVHPLVPAEWNLGRRSKYVSIYGDGPLVSQLHLAKGSTGPLLDWHGAFAFDVVFQGFSLWGSGQQPFIMRLDDGGDQYRVTLRDIYVHGNYGDGLLCENQRRLILDGVTVVGCSETGIVLTNCVCVDVRSPDVEKSRCGIRVEKGKGTRRNGEIIIDTPYFERILDDDIHIDNVTAVAIRQGTWSQISIMGHRARCNVIEACGAVPGWLRTVHFSSGAHENRVYCWDGRKEGPDADRNYVGPPPVMEQ